MTLPRQNASRLALALAVAALLSHCGSTGGTGGGGGGGGGGGSSFFTEDGDLARPPSYRPCLSNMECSDYESCVPASYYARDGICTRACRDDSDCSGDVCVSKLYRTCERRCSSNSQCAKDNVCGDAGVCTYYWDPSGDPCTRPSKCSADPVRSPSEIDACRQGMRLPDGGTPKCNPEANAFGACATAKQVCGADNKTDGVATLSACKTEYDAYTRCLTM